MRRDNLFWGTIITLLGVVLLLNSMGLIQIENFWTLFWPLALILMGLWFLLGPLFFKPSFEQENLTVPLEGTVRARLKIRHGIGRLELGSTSDPAVLLTGQFDGGLAYEKKEELDETRIKLRLPATCGWGFFTEPRENATWQVYLNQSIPLSLNVKAGVSQTVMNLSDLKVAELLLDAGASKTEITLPAAGKMQANIKAGASTLRLHVPSTTAARVYAHGQVARLEVDEQRYQKISGGYETRGFDAADHKIEISIDTGAASISLD